MHEAVTLAGLLAMVVLWRVYQGHCCIECGGRIRHRPDCPSLHR